MLVTTRPGQPIRVQPVIYPKGNLTLRTLSGLDRPPEGFILRSASKKPCTPRQEYSLDTSASPIAAGKRADVTVFALDEIERRPKWQINDAPDGKGGAT